MRPNNTADRRRYMRVWICVVTAWIFSVGTRGAEPAPTLWVSAYYPGWQHERMKPGAIDFSAFTHLIHFSAIVRANGALDFETHGITAERARETIAEAHDGKHPRRPVLLCAGGGETGGGFQKAIKAESRAALIANLIDAVKTRGYDGLDIDMEPIGKSDAENYSAFIHALRVSMKKENEHWLLTAATGGLPKMFAGLQDDFDQINVMTYDMSGPWEGWVVWHNSPLTSGAGTFPGGKRPLPSVEANMREWLDAGVKPAKLGMGLAFYATVWHGVSAPGQPVDGAKTEELGFEEAMRKYFGDQTQRLHWDEGAQVPWLGVDAAEAKDRAFVTLEDEKSVTLKVEYARKTGLGGLIIWELGSGYFANKPEGKRDALLQAVKAATFKE